MKVWTDDHGINVQWDRRGRVPVPGRRMGSFLAGLGLSYAIFDQITASATHAPGSWLTWQGISFIAGLMLFVTGLVLIVYRTAVPLPRRSHPLRLGEVYLSELPGVLLILLAGAEYRRALAGILERRAKRADVVLAPTRTPAVYHPPAVNERGGILCGHERIVEIHRHGGGCAAQVCTACGERLSAGENEG